MADGGRLVNPALDQAPVVDFHIPPDEMQLLFARRAVIQVTINELQLLKSEAAKDFDRYAYEAQLYAGVAASWAIVLTVCDTARGLLSARFRSAERHSQQSIKPWRRMMTFAKNSTKCLAHNHSRV
ncbi:MAG: hypothetical protein ACRCXM_17295, partial [Beijerinckiaceae bacterium]